MKESTSNIQKEKLFFKTYRPKTSHLYALGSDYDFLKKCLKINNKNFMNYPKICLEIGMRFRYFTYLNYNELSYIYSILDDGILKKSIYILMNKDYKAILDNRELFYRFYFYGGKSLRKNLNFFIPLDKLEYLSKDDRFYRFVNLVVTSESLNKIALSLLTLNYKKYSSNIKFMLAINAIKFNRLNLATDILENIWKYHKTSKIAFWNYLLTKDVKFKNFLLSQNYIDFYTLYIKQLFHKKLKYENKIIFNTAKENLFDVTNPFELLDMIDRLKKSDNYIKYLFLLDKDEYAPYKVYILNKIHRYKKNFFITPKYKALIGLSNYKKAIIYAIARQESMFMPASLSYVYAIGLMQLMPFLIKELDKKHSIYEYFNPELNLRTSIKHLNWLERNFNNPLFVAYAYNGGYGYTKRNIVSLFKKHYPYQPFISMELISYKETREYGKKVLRNYIIYKNILGDKITLLDFFEKLH